jgi:chaperonin cofactor prefoldin
MSTSSESIAVRGATSKRQEGKLDKETENLDRAIDADLNAALKLPKTFGSAIRT